MVTIQITIIVKINPVLIEEKNYHTVQINSYVLCVLITVIVDAVEGTRANFVTFLIFFESIYLL